MKWKFPLNKREKDKFPLKERKKKTISPVLCKKKKFFSKHPSFSSFAKKIFLSKKKILFCSQTNGAYKERKKNFWDNGRDRLWRGPTANGATGHVVPSHWKKAWSRWRGGTTLEEGCGLTVRAEHRIAAKSGKIPAEEFWGPIQCGAG